MDSLSMDLLTAELSKLPTAIHLLDTLFYFKT